MLSNHQAKLPIETVLAGGALRSHIARKHPGAWGNCEHKDCADVRYRIRYGVYPATPRHLNYDCDQALLGSLNA